MSFEAKLKLDNKIITILDYSLIVDQQTDPTGRPSASVVAGQISLSLEMSDFTKELSRWALSDTSTKDGKIVFYNNNLSGIMRTIDFKSAFCVRYTENFHHMSASPYLIDIIISAKDISIDDEPHKNNWPMAN
ncbi:type VI secretion system tube protein TssD [uncultured Maribacter sp.]|uniref:type VI secretion system tube protein TssD n=1 Tax=uncultured Maribacter sp. TaxID=431308 RepID=UPI00262599D7|nr:type VI secretion system tube protein TssD [uncultured Maribacter sp.]